MSEKFSSGTENHKQTIKQTIKQYGSNLDFRNEYIFSVYRGVSTRSDEKKGVRSFFGLYMYLDQPKNILNIFFLVKCSLQQETH